MEPPRRKGSTEQKPNHLTRVVFTGHSATERSPMSVSYEWVRKGGGCGENPQVTGDGVKPALNSQLLSGEAALTHCIANDT